jgi:hypothetical protein
MFSFKNPTELPHQTLTGSPHKTFTYLMSFNCKNLPWVIGS